MNQSITEYLEKKGKMSRKDIMDDTGADYLDLDIAEMDGVIEKCNPCPGGSGVWYSVVLCENE